MDEFTIEVGGCIKKGDRVLADVTYRSFAGDYVSATTIEKFCIKGLADIFTTMCEAGIEKKTAA